MRGTDISIQHVYEASCHLPSMYNVKQVVYGNPVSIGNYLIQLPSELSWRDKWKHSQETSGTVPLLKTNYLYYNLIINQLGLFMLYILLKIESKKYSLIFIIYIFFILIFTITSDKRNTFPFVIRFRPITYCIVYFMYKKLAPL